MMLHILSENGLVSLYESFLSQNLLSMFISKMNLQNMLSDKNMLSKKLLRHFVDRRQDSLMKKDQ